VFYLKSGKFSIIFRKMAAVLNQMNRDHLHNPKPLKPIVLLLLNLRLIFHKFSVTIPLPHTFYLPRPFNHPLFDDYKIITDWRIESSNPSVGEIFSLCSDCPQSPHNPLFNRYCFPLSKAMRPGRDFDHPIPSSAHVKHW
jgi:hypothetical protein